MSNNASEGNLARYAASRLATAVLVLIGSMTLLCLLTSIVPRCATLGPTWSGSSPDRR